MRLRGIRSLGLCLLVAGAMRSAGAQSVVVQGVVLDTIGHPLAGANVTVVSRRTQSQDDHTPRFTASAITDSAGRFSIPGVPTKAPYTFSARMIGYGASVSKVIWLGEGAAPELQFEMAPVMLAKVTVLVTRPEYHLDSLEIRKHAAMNARDLLVRYRPRMLGDTYKMCPATRAGQQTVSNGSSSRRRNSTLRNWAPQGPRFQLFINGELHLEESPAALLNRIRPEDIQEMRYVDCWDGQMPRLRNSLIVILKPGVEY